MNIFIPPALVFMACLIGAAVAATLAASSAVTSRWRLAGVCAALTAVTVWGMLASTALLKATAGA